MPRTAAPTVDRVKPLARRTKLNHHLEGLDPAERREFEQLLAQGVEFIDHPAFHEKDAYRKLFVEPAPLPTPNTSWYHPAMERVVDWAAPAIENKVLTAQQEQVVFLQFNYARSRAAALLAKASRGRLDAQGAREALSWHKMAKALEDQIVKFNLALVLAMIRRMHTQADHADLISEGNLVLIHAVDKFDISRGYKFSTYACRSILRALGRVGEKHSRNRGLFPATFEESREAAEPERFEDRIDTAEGLTKLRAVIASNAAQLTPLEKMIIECRFPLDGSSPEWLTLRDLGKRIGYTKERTRQLQCQALAKLRQAMELPLPN